MEFKTIDELIAKTFSSVSAGSFGDLTHEGVKFGDEFFLAVPQDCCNCSDLDVTGDLNDLVDTPIVLAEAATEPHDINGDSHTFTVYKFRTIKGDVTLMFRGESNGYYAEEADLMNLKDEYSYYTRYTWTPKLGV